jgi:hypothetical protein
MNEVSNFYWRMTVKIVMVLGVVLIVSFLACSRDTEDPAWFQSTESGESLDDTALISMVGTVDNLITLHRMKAEYEHREGGSVPVNTAMKKRGEQLLAGRPPLGRLCEEVDLIAFDYRKISHDRYQADYLLKINRGLRSELRITLVGAVAPEDSDQLSAKRRKAGKKSEVWKFMPSPPAPDWVPGEYLLLSQTFKGQDIPYNMSMVLSDPERKPGQYGDWVTLGWRRGIPENALLDSIDWADNFIDLFRLEGDCENYPSGRNAFQKKAAELLEESPPLGQICKEADLVAFDYSQIGENRYRVDCLFRVNQPIDTDCRITLIGVVDENHRALLSKKRREKGKKSEKWAFRPFPGTKDWPAGKYVLVSDVIEAQPIPYEMYIHLIDRAKRKAHGERIYLGWRADPGESQPAER